MTTDTSEKGLETLIMRHMTGTDGLSPQPHMVAERQAPYGGTGYTAGSADVVAGKLDVREAALHLQDQLGDADRMDEGDGLIEAEDAAVEDLDVLPEEAEQ